MSDGYHGTVRYFFSSIMKKGAVPTKCPPTKCSPTKYPPSLPLEVQELIFYAIPIFPQYYSEEDIRFWKSLNAVPRLKPLIKRRLSIWVYIDHWQTERDFVRCSCLLDLAECTDSFFILTERPPETLKDLLRFEYIRRNEGFFYPVGWKPLAFFDLHNTLQYKIGDASDMNSMRSRLFEGPQSVENVLVIKTGLYDPPIRQAYKHLPFPGATVTLDSPAFFMGLPVEQIKVFTSRYGIDERYPPAVIDGIPFVHPSEDTKRHYTSMKSLLDRKNAFNNFVDYVILHCVPQLCAGLGQDEVLLSTLYEHELSNIQALSPSQIYEAKRILRKYRYYFDLLTVLYNIKDRS